MDSQNIKRLLSQAGMSRKRLAQLTGLNKNTIDNLLTGRVRSPRMDTLSAISEVLKCSLDQFTRTRGTALLLTDLERKLIQSVRNIPNFDTGKLVDILSDRTERRESIRQIVRAALLMPDNVLKDYSSLGQSLVTIIKPKEGIQP